MTADRRVALVTGASRGLGAAITRALATGGVDVAINFAQQKATADQVREEVVAFGGNAEVFQADVTERDEVDDLYRRVLAAFGQLDILVCNATGPQPEIAVEDLHWQDVLDQLRFFVKSPLLLAQRAIPGMKRQRYGRIVHIGSEVVELGVADSSAYVAAKGAQLGLTRSWARELGGYGITVNLVAPGWVPTDRHLGVPDTARHEYAANVPLGHVGSSTDVAEAVAFLASDRAGFVTGQRIAVNGGNTLV